MNQRRTVLEIRMILAAILLTPVSAACGQTWSAMGSGLWSDGDNWDTMMEPMFGDNVTLPDMGQPYTVTIDSSPTLNSLQLQGSSVRAKLNGGLGLNISSSGGILNNGIFTINSFASGSQAIVNASTTMSISGTGTIKLNAAPGFPSTAKLQASGMGILTIGSGQTIEGTGTAAPGSGMTIRMNGLYDANVNGEDLTLGGVQDFSGGGRAQGSNGGRLHALGATITGGQFLGGVEMGQSSIGAGLTLFGNNAVTSTMVTIIQGGIINNGTLTINSTGTGPGKSLIASVDTSITGTGLITLNGGPTGFNASIFTAGPGTLTIGSGQIVDGIGSVNGNFGGTIAMNGLYNANVNGTDLELRGTHDLTGGGQALGSNGGHIFTLGANITGGQFLGSVELGNGTIIGGGLTMSGSNGVRDNGHATIDAGGIINNGAFTINTAAADTNTTVSTTDVSTSILGTGTITLNAPNNIFRATLGVHSNGTLAIGPNQTIDGRGVLSGGSTGSIIVQGTLAPGFNQTTGGEMTMFSSIALSPTSQTEIELMSLSDFDILSGSSVLAIDGTLDIQLRGGYIPNAGDRFLIIDAFSIAGSFASFQSPTVGGLGFRLEQSANTIEIVWTCFADVNGDGVLTAADFTAWIAAFNAGDLAADQNQDGLLTPTDFTAWIANFNAGC